MEPKNETLTFAYPWLLTAVALLVVLVILRQLGVAKSGRLLSQVVATRLKEQILAGLHPWRRALRFWLVVVGLLAIILACARPQFGYIELPTKRRGLDVIIALDTSRSMLAQDVEPTRLERAKFAIQDLMATLQGDRLGLVCFAGDAFLQCPLVTDYNAFKIVLDEVDTDLLPTGGTNLAKAIDEAMKGFSKSEGDSRALVLITDGEELDEDGVAAARKAKEAGIRVFALGFGTPEGTKITITRNGRPEIVLDPSGQEVISRLDEKRLEQVASAGGGQYLRFEGTSTMRKLVGEGLGTMQRQDIDTRERRRPVECYQWPLGLGLLLFVLGVIFPESPRRRLRPAMALLLAATMVGMSGKSAAADQGEKLYQQGEYAQAYETYKKRLAKDAGEADKLEFAAGTAAYKAGQYETAAEHLGRAILSEEANLRAQAHYNLGNTFYQLGAKAEAAEDKKKVWQSAINQYRETEKAGPSMASRAAHNREIVEKKLKELEAAEKQKQDEQKKEEQKPDEKKQEDEQKKQEEQKSEEQKKEQEEQKSEEQKKQEEQKSEEQKKESGQEKQQSQDGQKDQQPGEQEKKDAGQEQKPGQDGEKKDGQGGGEGERQEKKDDPSKGGQPESGKGEEKPEPPKEPAGVPEGSAKKEEPKKSGELKALNQAEKKPGQQPEKAEPSAFELMPDGKMSPAAAKALLESLEGDEIQGQSMRRQGKQRVRVMRDW